MSRIVINDLDTTNFESFIEDFDHEIPKVLGSCYDGGCCDGHVYLVKHGDHYHLVIVYHC